MRRVRLAQDLLVSNPYAEIQARIPAQFSFQATFLPPVPARNDYQTTQHAWEQPSDLVFPSIPALDGGSWRLIAQPCD